MSQAQNNAFKQSKEKRQTIKAEVLEFIKSRDEANEYQVIARLGGKRATIIGRLSELQDEGKIYVVGTFNGKKNSVYKYEPNEERRKQHAKKRLEEKKERWIKVGVENGWI